MQHFNQSSILFSIPTNKRHKALCAHARTRTHTHTQSSCKKSLCLPLWFVSFNLFKKKSSILAFKHLSCYVLPNLNTHRHNFELGTNFQKGKLPKGRHKQFPCISFTILVTIFCYWNSNTNGIIWLKHVGIQPPAQMKE